MLLLCEGKSNKSIPNATDIEPIRLTVVVPAYSAVIEVHAPDLVTNFYPVVFVTIAGVGKSARFTTITRHITANCGRSRCNNELPRSRADEVSLGS